MKKNLLPAIIVFLCFCSCRNDVDISNIPYEPKIVVEGSIENGSFATVLLSVSAPVTGVLDTVSLLNHVIRSAKVTVSNKDTFEYLYLRTNREKIPPYEYRGKVVKGEAGENYSLKIEYDGNVITAETYIPVPVELDDIWFRTISETDTVGYIGISFKNTSNEFYRLATSPFSVKNVFTPCLYGNIDSRQYSQNEQVEFELNRGPTIYPENNFSTYFSETDTLRIKFSTQTQSAYEFWCSYQNELLNAQNPLFPAFSSLKSNISGGIGIWSGYGSNVYIVNLADVKR